MARRFTSDRLVLATHNAGKVREISALLAPFGISVQSAAELELPEPEETETTFAGNARIKAHAAAQAAGLTALADDSGMSVDALGGDPGVYSADWAETPKGRDFTMAMARVWDACDASAAPEPRTARFEATLCLAWPDGHDEIVSGTVPGRLVWPPRGDGGFGYDGMFLPDGERQTFGEMSAERKQAMSHRTRAFAALVATCFDG